MNRIAEIKATIEALTEELAELEAKEAAEPTDLQPGETAQYRKVGKVRVLGMDNPEGFGRDRKPGEIARYSVEFVTGPKKYREAGPTLVWISAKDRA